MITHSTTHHSGETPPHLVSWFIGLMVTTVLEAEEGTRKMSQPQSEGEGVPVWHTLSGERTPEEVKQEARRLLEPMSDAAFETWLLQRCTDYFAPHWPTMLADLEKESPTMTRKGMLEWVEKWKANLREDNESAASRLGLCFDYNADLHEIWPEKACPEYPEMQVTLTRLNQTVATAAVKFGGEPEWVQEPEVPICPECDGDMAPLMQMKSLPASEAEQLKTGDAFQFGDCGTLWLFGCQTCLKFHPVWQCY